MIKIQSEKDRKVLERFESKFNKSDGCWEWEASKTYGGYGHLKFNGTMQLAHRVAYQLYIGEIPDGLYVLHHCDNRKCVNPEHLFLGTQKDNMCDRDSKGRGVIPDNSGENHGLSKLSKKQVLEIIDKRARGFTTVAIAKEFGVARTTISGIVCGRRWQSALCSEGGEN